MHQNYYFLKKLVPRLSEELTGKFLVETFSQEKDELVLVFASAVAEDSLENPFFIKAMMRSDFSSLSFPDKFDRARRNSVNLFAGFEGLKIISVKPFLNERAFAVNFQNGSTLVFKMYGNRSNLIGFNSKGSLVEVFNNKLTADHHLSPGDFDRPIEQTLEAYIRQGLKHEPLFPTFGKQINTYLNQKLAGVTAAEARWQIVQDVLNELNDDRFYLVQYEPATALSLLPLGEVKATYTDPIEALNAFYYAFIRLTGIEREKGEIIRILNKRLRQTENFLENTFSKLVELESAVRNDELANIIMANLHQIPARAEVAELYDFYRDQPIRIKLKKDLSPQKNAEGYYRKSKNEKIELERLNENLAVREEEKIKLTEHLKVIADIELLREMRTYIKVNGLNGGTPNGNAPAAELFKKVELMGYIILIGRNAKNNDLLTRQYASKEDLWLHARDVTGSHVVIKKQPGKNFPLPVIERAAELAAFYSKRKNDSLCPVIVTPKKYVRKLKGMPEGAVIVDKEDVVMVVAKGE
ncbi:MAG TPA: NFACT RNA binding domain-containing protein [Dyadobacter sp.]|nr:NFACT RNA binding domain-containing protein [Dyadobacter sp.]